MSNGDFVLNYEYPVPVENLYHQFASAEGVRHWWTENCTMDARLGGDAKFDFPDADFYASVIIKRLEKDQCVEWQVKESRHPKSSGWNDLHDWEGTHIRFELSPIDSHRSNLQFTHEGLVPLECHDSCSSIWRFYLNQSLRNYLEKGQGEPYRDGK